MNDNSKGKAVVILLVEADPVLRQNLHDIFDLTGYQVIAASNSADGLDILRAMPLLPNVIVTDISRTDRDGCKLFNAVRREWQRHPIPFVVLSANFQGKPPCPDLRGEAVEIVTKPFPVARLLAALAKATSQAQVG